MRMGRVKSIIALEHNGIRSFANRKRLGSSKRCSMDIGLLMFLAGLLMGFGLGMIVGYFYLEACL